MDFRKHPALPKTPLEKENTMEIMVKKLTANLANLVSYPISEDDAPVETEAVLNKRIGTAKTVTLAGGSIFFGHLVVTLFSVVGLLFHYGTWGYGIDTPEYIPMASWIYMFFMMVAGITAWSIAQGRVNAASDAREKLYLVVPQGRIVDMDHRDYGNNPHVKIEGYNSRNQIRRQWHKITDGQWENWVNKYIEHDIYVDFRLQDDAGE